MGVIKILGIVKCWLCGHKLNSPSIINTFCSNNWLKKCDRCGLYIILMRQYFRGVPKELEEAAYIDGAGTVKTFISIMLPSAKTMMITGGLFSFVWIWLDSDFAPTLMPDMPLLANQFDKIASTWRTAANSSIVTSLYYNTAVIILILPRVILYLFTQKYFVESIERSGLVG